MMTVHVLSAGDGYTYYTDEVATGDSPRERDRELGDYYTSDGNPPGLWAGSGLSALGVSGTVTEDQMKALYGEGLHPNAEQMIRAAQAEGLSASAAYQSAKLGRAYYGYTAGTSELADKISTEYAAFERINGREPEADERRRIRVREGAQAFREAKQREPADKEELGRFITAATRPASQAVAGFDLVFSPAKSVSVLWALGDESTRKAVEEAQRNAIDDTIGYLEREAIATRAGTNGVAQIDVQGGLIATRFRHYDSRTGDPQLHDHLVVANKVLGSDGKWRTIDSKLLHRQGVAASEFYNSRIMELVEDKLGVSTELREVTPGKRPVVEIAGVDETLADQFSSRSVGIRKATKRLEAEYRATHGRDPDLKARIRLAQQATLETRPEKPHSRALSELRGEWRSAAVATVGAERVDGLLSRAQLVAQERRDHVSKAELVSVADAARTVVETVSEHHAVWGPHMIEAEARRYVQSQRAAGKTVTGSTEEITQRALTNEAISVTPPGAHGAFEPLTRSSGESIYSHKGRMLLTSATVLSAEDTLLDAARAESTRAVGTEVFSAVAARENAVLAAAGKPLDEGQLALARAFATSDRQLTVGTGAAGTGKTTALSVAARAVEAEGGRMFGLAPSAAAAAVLGEAVGIDAMTIHRFVHEQGSLSELLERQESTDLDLHAGDVIVVDEAGMAGSVNLAKVTRIAELHGAQVRLIGDDRQLGAVEAGGALGLLEREVGSVNLDSLHRFSDKGEAEATKLLRDPTQKGEPFRWYLDHERVIGGDLDRMTEEVFTGWQRDTHAGLDSVMLAQTNEAVHGLNQLAQSFRMSQHQVSEKHGAELRDGLAAHEGDVIVTRRNDSRIRTTRRGEMIKNGDLWTVEKTGRDGSLDVRHNGTGERTVLPTEYVNRYVQLGYASTVHRAQGITADTAHMLADSSTSRELAYVGMTRGRHRNQLYIHTEPAEAVRDVLNTIATNTGDMLSAHETIRAEQERVESFSTLIDQFQDVAARADAMRFDNIVHDSLGPEIKERLTSSDAWGAVEAALMRAEDSGLDARQITTEAWMERDMVSAEDAAAVLSYRLERRLDRTAGQEGMGGRDDARPVPSWIADDRALRSRALDPDWRNHLAERYEHLSERFKERESIVTAEPPAWTQQLGDMPTDPARATAWKRLAAEVDVFRERYHVDQQETAAIPDKYRKDEVGAQLHARITAMHKAAALREHAAAAADRQATPADRVRAAQQQKAQAQREALRRAGMKIKERPQGPRNADKQRAADLAKREQQRSRDDGREL